MDNFISRSMTLVVILLVITAGLGIRWNIHARDNDMPAGIKYIINAHQNVWPDNFYASSYTSSSTTSFFLDGYWTFEHSSHPFGGPVWEYHTNQLTITDSNFTVATIITVTK